MKEYLTLLKGRKVNLFIDNTLLPNLSKNHVGKVMDVYEDSVVLELSQPSNTISINIRIDKILAVLELKEGLA